MSPEGEEAAIHQFLSDLQEIMQSEDIKVGVQSFIFSLSSWVRWERRFEKPYCF
jgi:hypothetical protein